MTVIVLHAKSLDPIFFALFAIGVAMFATWRSYREDKSEWRSLRG
jgi:hypothetical protein